MRIRVYDGSGEGEEAKAKGPPPYNTAAYIYVRERERERESGLIYGPARLHRESYTRYHNTINSSSNSPLTESYWPRSKSPRARAATNVNARARESVRCSLSLSPSFAVFLSRSSFEPRGQVRADPLCVLYTLGCQLLPRNLAPRIVPVRSRLLLPRARYASK